MLLTGDNPLDTYQPQLHTYESKGLMNNAQI